MAALAADWTMQWASQLADVADSVIKEIPQKGEWDTVRDFLSHTTNMLRQGDVRSGFKAVMKVLPYVQRALSSVEKYNKINSTFDVTHSISEHFLVSDHHRENLENFMNIIEDRIGEIRCRIERLAMQLDNILDDVIEKEQDLGWWNCVKLAFEINRISALIKTSEDLLETSQHMLDELDTHVAGKSFVAYIFMYISFLFGIFFSASGNIPVGSVCISAATATQTATKSLNDYRRHLSEIDTKHRKLQAELTEWKHKFNAEQKNFVYMFGPQKFVVILLLILVMLLVIGRPGNIAVYGLVLSCLLFRSYVSESNCYTAAILVAIVAVWVEYQYFYGLVGFNLAACAISLANYVGFIDFWW